MFVSSDFLISTDFNLEKRFLQALTF